jgi:histidine triad (HIT) family protein|tara:strand:+ start:718 stop:1062 length:345 start_codon:yes stop_codon:yes gene_type:complete
MNDCLFCGIINGEVKGDIVFRNDSVVAFKDINPKAPVHLLIVPRKHIATLSEMEDEDAGRMGEVIQVAAELAKENEISQDGYRVVVNCGAAAGQSVYHLHFHLLGGRSFKWPPG